MRLIKNYNELNKFFSFFENFVKSKQLSHANNLLLLRNEFKCFLGCILIGERLEKISKYISNRYFMEATQCNEIKELNDVSKIDFSNDIIILFPDLFKKKDIDTNKKYELFLNKIYSLYKNTIDEHGFPVDKFWNLESKSFFEKNGYYVFKNVFTLDDANSFKKEIYRIANNEKNASVAYLYGFNNSLQRVYNLINKTKAFDNLVKNPLITSIMDDLFDRDTLHQKYVIASWHANIINTGGASQVVHVDSAVPEPLPPWIIRANVNYIVEDYTVENGATRCLPGSHLFLKKPTDTEINKYKDQFVDLVAPAGSVVIWHGHLWHCSGENKSKKARVGLLGCYAATHLLEMCLEENHPLIVNESRKNNMDTDLKKLFSLEHGIKPGSSHVEKI